MVRPMREDDAEAVAHLLRAAYGTPDGGAISSVDGPNLPLTARRVRRWRQCSSAAWVAEVAGYGPVGAVFAVIEPEAAWMAGLGVAPNFRGAGLGAALTDHALKYLAASGCPLLGMEAAPPAVGAAGLYARRGFRPADLTVRLRGKAAELGAAVDPMVWRESACPDFKDRARGIDSTVAARVHAQPQSAQSYLLERAQTSLLCDPDPFIPAAGGSLDLRLVMSSAPHGREVVTSLAAAAASANARGLTAIEIDLALADGDLLRSLLRSGMAPIASTIRLVNNFDAYVAWRRRNGPIGRWSF